MGSLPPRAQSRAVPPHLYSMLLEFARGEWAEYAWAKVQARLAREAWERAVVLAGHRLRAPRLSGGWEAEVGSQEGVVVRAVAGPGGALEVSLRGRGLPPPPGLRSFIGYAAGELAGPGATPSREAVEGVEGAKGRYYVFDLTTVGGVAGLVGLLVVRAGVGGLALLDGLARRAWADGARAGESGLLQLSTFLEELAGAARSAAGAVARACNRFESPFDPVTEGFRGLVEELARGALERYSGGDTGAVDEVLVGVEGDGLTLGHLIRSYLSGGGLDPQGVLGEVEAMARAARAVEAVYRALSDRGLLEGRPQGAQPRGGLGPLGLLYRTIEELVGHQ